MLGNTLSTVRENKVAQNITAIIIGLLYGAGEIAEARLAVEEALRAYKSEMTEAQAQSIALKVALSLGVIAALQGGAVVYYHVINKLKHHDHEHHHHHDHVDDDTNASTTCSGAKTSFAYVLTYLGMLLQGGLSLASWRQVTKGLPLAAQLPLQIILALGRVTGSYFLHGTHIHNHLNSAESHHHHADAESVEKKDGTLATRTDSSVPISMCCERTARLAGLLVLYGLLWLGHAAQAYFEAYETGEYIFAETNSTKTYLDHAWLQTLCQSLYLSTGAVVGLQQALVEAQHVREVPETWEKFKKASFAVKIASVFTSVFGSMAHLLPELAGVMLIGRFVGMDFITTLSFAAACIALDFLPAMALHFPYNLKISKKAVMGTGAALEKFSMWASCRRQGYERIDEPFPLENVRIATTGAALPAPTSAPSKSP